MRKELIFLGVRWGQSGGTSEKPRFGPGLLTLSSRPFHLPRCLLPCHGKRSRQGQETWIPAQVLTLAGQRWTLLPSQGVWLFLWNEGLGQAASKVPSSFNMYLGLAYSTRDHRWGVGPLAALSQSRPEEALCVYGQQRSWWKSIPKWWHSWVKTKAWMGPFLSQGRQTVFNKGDLNKGKR